MAVTIYGLWHPKESEYTLCNVRYVGKTIQSIDKRLREHLKLGSGCVTVRRWVDKRLRPWGMMPWLEVLEVVSEIGGSNTERQWIAKARKAKRKGDPRLLNATDGGDGFDSETGRIAGRGGTKEQKSAAGRKGGRIGGRVMGQIHKEKGTGICGLTTEQRAVFGRKGAEVIIERRKQDPKFDAECRAKLARASRIRWAKHRARNNND